MILTDYFRAEPDITWDYAVQCGVQHGVIRLPETPDFDITSTVHWDDLCHRFTKRGIKPLVLEPIPNCLHDHIKTGDKMRDECIDRLIAAFPHMSRWGITTICFNFMAYIGWLRTSSSIRERGGALVTGFDMEDFRTTGYYISEDMLWKNYEYFLRAVIPEAERWGIRLALHPDDPPVAKLGGVSRIMVSLDAIKKALSIVESENLGITMCQATYCMMGEDVHQAIDELSSKIFFVHFRNCCGYKENFRETFHDNGMLDMGSLIRHYERLGLHVPIRVDHVPLMAGEDNVNSGYTALGRLYAIGYLKGLMEMCGGTMDGNT